MTQQRLERPTRSAKMAAVALQLLTEPTGKPPGKGREPEEIARVMSVVDGMTDAGKQVTFRSK